MNLMIMAGSKPASLKVAEASHTYRCDFNDWIIRDGCEVEITKNGTVAKIKKFHPYGWCMRSNESPKRNTDISAKYSHWKLHIQGLANVNVNGSIPYLPFHPSGDGGQTYRVHGFMSCPLMSNAEWFFRFPWDMGITSGSWKDQNGGWSACGYIYDGVRDRCPFTSFSDGWGDNSNCQMGIGIYRDIQPDTNLYVYTDSLPSSSSAVDVNKKYVKYTVGPNGCPQYIPTINADGTVKWTQDGYYTETVDISDNPIIITLQPQDSTGYDPSTEEIFKAYVGEQKVYDKDKTVENTLEEYFKAYRLDDGSVVLPNVFPQQYDTSEQTRYLLPSANKIADLYDYSPKTLRMEMDAFNTGTYAQWYTDKLAEVDFGGADGDPGIILRSGKYLCGKVCQNSEDNPIVLTIPYSGRRGTGNAEDSYKSWDGLTYDGETRDGAKINNLKIIFKAVHPDCNQMVSVMMRAFQTYDGNVDIIHEDSEGNVITAHDAMLQGWGLCPLGLRSTFAGSTIPVIKREWFSWFRTQYIPYAFELMPNLTEIQAYEGDEIVFWPHNVPGCSGQWPYWIKVGNAMNPESYDMVQAFRGCSNLARIEPVLNVKYFPHAGFVYWAFGGIDNLKHVRIKGINNFNWDFTNTTNFGMRNLDRESIRYIFDNAEDLVATPYDPNNVDEANVSSTYPDLRFDHVNFRSNVSANGLTINCPHDWYYGHNTMINSTYCHTDKMTILDTHTFTCGTRGVYGSGTINTLMRFKKPVESVTIKIEGMVPGDRIEKATWSQAVAENAGSITQDGTYTLSFNADQGLKLYGDTGVTSAITFTLQPNGNITDEHVYAMNAKGWGVKIEGQEI